MNWWSDFADQIQSDVPLGKLTWFRLGGHAKHLFRPRDVEQLSHFVARARREGVPLKTLGGGANVLVSDDGFDGAVIRLDESRFCTTRGPVDDAEVGAGVDLVPFVRMCATRGLTGLESVIGVPGTMGGAVRMNAGGKYGDIGDAITGVTVLLPDGEIEEWSNERCGFGYRQSAITDEIVLSARLQLQEDDPKRTYDSYRDRFLEKQRSQPMASHSAGCIFKNPPGESAGSLIDRAGLKGVRSGLAEVSRVHANFIVAHAGAGASDVLYLIDVVRERVRNVFAIELELEIDVWHPTRKGVLV